MKDVIFYVFSEDSINIGDGYKFNRLLEQLGFTYSHYEKDLFSDVFENKELGKKIVVCKASKALREKFYKEWSREKEEEKDFSGLTLKKVLKEDYDIWSLCRGEWFKS